jgi:hypothetical protein
MRIHINYANNRYYKAQKRCSDTALQHGFDSSIQYKFEDLDPDFIKRNAWTLSCPRGAGFWIWKPYLILKTLQQMSKDDWLFYTDSGMYFVRNPWPYFLSNEDKMGEKGIMTFCTCNKNSTYCKRDTFILMGLDEDKYVNSDQRLASVFLCKKTQFSIDFVTEWLHYAQDPRIITDLQNMMGMPNYPNFEDHRHDQSIMSLLTHKYDTLVINEDLTQFSNSDPYIIHHRTDS